MVLAGNGGLMMYINGLKRGNGIVWIIGNDPERLLFGRWSSQQGTPGDHTSKFLYDVSKWGSVGWVMTPAGPHKLGIRCWTVSREHGSLTPIDDCCHYLNRLHAFIWDRPGVDLP